MAGQRALFEARPTLADGTALPALSREASPQLLRTGGLALGLAGLIIRLANRPAIDVDEVREILEAIREPDRFQPLLGLLQVA